MRIPSFCSGGRAFMFAPVPRGAPEAGAPRGTGGTPTWLWSRETQGGAAAPHPADDRGVRDRAPCGGSRRGLTRGVSHEVRRVEARERRRLRVAETGLDQALHAVDVHLVEQRAE